MDCGVPFCQTGTSIPGSGDIGCPVYNLIPEWNDLVSKGKWKEALERFIKQTISRNLQAEFVRHLVKAPVRSH